MWRPSATARGPAHSDLELDRVGTKRPAVEETIDDGKEAGAESAIRAEAKKHAKRREIRGG